MLKVLGTALFITAILTLLTPLVAVWNVNLLLALRIIMGVSEAVTFLEDLKRLNAVSSYLSSFLLAI